jgi:DNA-binding CsgD family transcriptional regulator
MDARPAHYRSRRRDLLTPRQREVLDLVARGYTNSQIADELGVTLDGAKFHVSEILDRLQVTSREEAAALWRSESGLGAGLRRLAGALVASKALLIGGAAAGALAIGAIVAFAVLSDDGDEPRDPNVVTVADLVAAVSQPGRVYYAEILMGTESGNPPTLREWYSPDLHATRSEIWDSSGAPSDIRVVVQGRAVAVDPQSGSRTEMTPRALPASAPDAAVYGLSHLSGFSGDPAATISLSGTSVLLEFVFVLGVEGAEEPRGTTTTANIVLSGASLLPATAHVRSVTPDGVEIFNGDWEWTVTTFVDPATLPAAHFDPDALRP